MSVPVPDGANPASECQPKNEDLILSAAFIADPVVCADVLVIHALLETLREIPLRTNEPLMGEIRLKWWYEGIEEIISGQTVRYHPILAALESLKGRRQIDLTPLLSMIEAQGALLDEPGGLERIERAVEGGEVIAARMGAGLTAPEMEASVLDAPARFYGFSLFIGDGGVSRETVTADIRERKLAEARAALKRTPTALMPHVAHVGLARDYIAGRQPGPLKRRFSVLGCFLTGRL